MNKNLFLCTSEGPEIGCEVFRNVVQVCYSDAEGKAALYSRLKTLPISTFWGETRWLSKSDR